jgi:signal transduction histidine kinase
VKVVARQAPPDRVLISVTDCGPGIPVERHRELFRPSGRATRCDDLTSQGVGLSIVHSFVTAMGGDIWVESDGTSGTTFCISLPAAPRDAA